MKYILAILTITLTLSVITLVLIWPPPLEKEEPVVTINGFTISRKSLQNIEERTGRHHNDQGDLLDAVITKHLLVDEAQRQNIDKEPTFRIALKNYYEQSLIKLLTERMYESTHVTINEDEIENYLSCFGKTYTFTLLKAKTLPSLTTIQQQGKQQSELFDELGEPLKQVCAKLLPGDISMSFVTGNETYALLLNKIEGVTNIPANLNRESVFTTLLDYKKEQEINNWITALRKKASITIHEGKP